MGGDVSTVEMNAMLRSGYNSLERTGRRVPNGEPVRCRTAMSNDHGQWPSLATPRFREQPKNFKIQPDKRDHQPESPVPLHIFWSIVAGSSLDHIEIEH
jgi:hypothetical protein